MSVEAISAVLHNSKAKGTTKLVLIGIANHEGDGGAWPSIETLCKYSGCSRSTVKSAIRWLVENGELEVLVQQGGNDRTRSDRRPNLYCVLVKMNGGQSAHPRPNNGGQNEPARGSKNDFTGVSGQTPNRPLEPSLIKIPVIDEIDFDRFWQAYPVRTGKKAAERAFVKAVEGGTNPTRLIEAAIRFAKDPNRVDQFTPYPATWLNQGRWEDEPLPDRPEGKSVKKWVNETAHTRAIISRPKTEIPKDVELELGELRKRLGGLTNQKNADKAQAQTNGGDS
jgi:hypothetical protein